MPEGTTEVRGYDFNNGVNYSEIFGSYLRTGFQATSIGQAIDQINKMVCGANPAVEIHISRVGAFVYSFTPM